MNPVQVIAVTGGRGGCGKTNVTVNLALGLASLGRRVMILDADLALANAHVLLGLTSKQTVADVLRGTCSAEQAMLTFKGNVRLLPGTCGDLSMANLTATQQAGLIHAVSDIRDTPDALIIDTASGISDSTMNFIRASRQVLVVITDEPASLNGAYNLIKLLNRNYGINHFHVLANMTRTPHEGRALFSRLVQITDRFLSVVLDYLGDVPFDESVRAAAQKRRAVFEAYPKSKCAMAYQKLAKKVDEWPLPVYPRAHLEFFGDNLLNPALERLAS
ncbi:MinD/ParA family protein [Pseudomonas songnenensis]|uniref:MinD/ParA family protein n=1 Tax=Pseudomonas songnenensis TaxID=1176259 RepID=UPI00142DCBBE|nr:MinD/ParA family protein [Pseudomonas songnenensis]